MPETATWYAWCFDHGRMHAFVPRGEAECPDGAWCTAAWSRLAGDSEEAAMADKQARYGDAQFLHHLPLETQLVVMEETSPRHG